jgi:PAS domain S-box-containing protein
MGVPSECGLDLAEAAPIALFVLQKGILRYVNRGIAASLGYERPEELIGMALRRLVHPDDQRHLKIWFKGQRLPQRSDRHEFRL